MQRAIVVSGYFSHHLGTPTLSSVINKILEEHKDWWLANAFVVRTSECTCTMLCVFESKEP